MTDDDEQSFVDRLSRQGEEALGKIAEELVANPVVNGALDRRLRGAREGRPGAGGGDGRAQHPSAADIERLTRRLRSVSQRLEGIEDALDRLEDAARRGRGSRGRGGDRDGSRRGSTRSPATSRRCARPWRPAPSPCRGRRSA